MPSYPPIAFPTTDALIQADEPVGGLNFSNNIAQWAQFDPCNVILTKIHGTFALPAFNNAVNPVKTAPYVITQFNYLATGNFVITGYPTFPTSPNYVLCIRYTDPITGDVVRYKIWGMDGDEIFYPLYEGQPIQANFALEVWSLASGTYVTQPDTTIQFQVSRTKIRTNPSGAGSYVESLPMQVISLFNINGPSQAPDLTNALIWLDPRANVTLTAGKVSNWQDKVGGFNFTNANAGQRPTQSGDTTVEFNGGDPDSLSSAVNFNGPIYTLYAVFVFGFFPTNFTQLLATDSSLAGILTGEVNVSGFFSFEYQWSSGYDIVTTPPVNVVSQSIILELTVNTVTNISRLSIFDIASGNELVKVIGTAPMPTPAGNFTVGGGTAILGVRDVLLYSGVQSSTQRTNTLQYLFQKWALNTEMYLPLIFNNAATMTPTPYVAPVPPPSPNTTPVPPQLLGANYRFNQTTGMLELYNVTTGKWCPIVAVGQQGAESIQFQTED